MGADLHCHTRFSDGSESVEYVVKAAKNRGLSHVAITDHDTMAAYPMAEQIGKQHGVQVIRGMELSCTDGNTGRKVHLLCYLPEDYGPLQEVCEATCLNRIREGERIAGQLAKHFQLPKEELLAHVGCSTGIFKQHLMRALMSAGYSFQIFGDLYRELFTCQDAPYRTRIQYPDVREVVKLIRNSGGVAVMAHPYAYDSIDVLKELAETKSIDGIEIYHDSCSKDKRPLLLGLAKTYGLLITGGSDFHGFQSTRLCPVGTYQTTDEMVERIYELKRQRT